MNKSQFVLSDGQTELIACPNIKDRSMDFKVKVIKESRLFYYLENGKIIRKSIGRCRGNQILDFCRYFNSTN